MTPVQKLNLLSFRTRIRLKTLLILGLLQQYRGIRVHATFSNLPLALLQRYGKETGIYNNLSGVQNLHCVPNRLVHLLMPRHNLYFRLSLPKLLIMPQFLLQALPKHSNILLQYLSNTRRILKLRHSSRNLFLPPLHSSLKVPTLYTNNRCHVQHGLSLH
jgi:hypothetical protein